MPAMSGAFGKSAAVFSSFTIGQKLVSVLVVIGLAVGGLFFSNWATKPTYAPLFTNLEPSDASAIVDELNTAGTPYELTSGGSTILVPQQQVYDMRLAMSGKGLTPSADSTGWGLLDKQGVTASKFQQQVAYRRALEGELNKTIQGIDGVTAAVVHLAIPEKDVFTKDTARSKASVLVDTAAGKELSSAQVQAVVNLIASSVDGMDAADVTVASSAGRVLSASADGSAGAAADSRSQQTRDFELRVADSLQAMVDRVVGAGNSEVRLTADLDFDQTSTKTEKFTDSAKKPIAGTSTRETYTGGATPGGGVLGGTGVLGPDNAAPEQTGVTGGGGGDYLKTTETNNNALDRVVEERKSAPGAVRKLNVAVLLNTRTAGTINPAQIEALVSSAVGLDRTRGDTVVVDRLPFDEKASKVAEKELAAEKKKEAAAARLDLYKTGGLAVLVILVLGYAILAGRKRMRGVFTAGERIQIEALQRTLDAAPGPAAVQPARAAIPIAPPDPRSELAEAARSEIGDLVKAQPEEVAELLRGWLADRRD